jgi:hypothetical protein
VRTCKKWRLSIYHGSYNQNVKNVVITSYCPNHISLWICFAFTITGLSRTPGTGPAGAGSLQRSKLKTVVRYTARATSVSEKSRQCHDPKNRGCDSVAAIQLSSPGGPGPGRAVPALDSDPELRRLSRPFALIVFLAAETCMTHWLTSWVQLRVASRCRRLTRTRRTSSDSESDRDDSESSLTVPGPVTPARFTRIL